MKLVSVVTPAFLPALKTLAYSLAEYGKISGLDWVLMWADDPVHGYENLVEPYGFKVIEVLPENMPSPPRFKWTKPLLKVAPYKLNYWLLKDDLYLALDLDMVCRKDARELLDMDDFSAEQRPGAPGFCSGLMVFRPSPAKYNVFLDIAADNYDVYRLADQDVLNNYYSRHEWNKLDWKWNTSHYEEYRQENGKQLIKDAIFIHYHGQKKPWLYYEEKHPLSFKAWHDAYNESFFALDK